jgi:hypothetical protein
LEVNNAYKCCSAYTAYFLEGSPFHLGVDEVEQNIKPAALDKNVGRECTLVLKRTDGKVDFATGIFQAETDTHFWLKVAGIHDTLYLKADVQKIEFKTEAV